jgi:hypothetical protein
MVQEGKCISVCNGDYIRHSNVNPCDKKLEKVQYDQAHVKLCIWRAISMFSSK